MSDIILSMKNISKSFGNNRVLENIDFDLYRGEVHILAGENGAGKSTLIKILAGVHLSYEGDVFLNGKELKLKSPLDACRKGISVVYQELSLVPNMSIVENIFLGNQITNSFGFVEHKKQRMKAIEIISAMGIDEDVNKCISDLPISTQQLIEISKAVYYKAQIFIMDEPSSSLSDEDVSKLFDLIRTLKSQGCAIIYISHKMEEIYDIGDRISVLRNGSLVASDKIEDMEENKLITFMIGKEISRQFEKINPKTDEEKLRIENYYLYNENPKLPPLINDLSFTLNKGEIVGIAGLQGSGGSDFLLSLFGAHYGKSSGRVILNGDEEIKNKNPRSAIKKYFSMLTNDRKSSGLIMAMSICENFCISSLDVTSRHGWRNIKKERINSKEMGKRLSLKADSIDMYVSELSGGNQQKVVIGKCLQTSPKILILDEPTRGIDVGAKAEIYRLMNKWISEGMSILLITSEMPELIALSHKIIVLHRGCKTAEYSKEEVTAELILSAAMGK